LTTDKIAVIIPALNEEKSIEQVIRDIPKNLVSDIIVVDNGSTDSTGNKARTIGAKVVEEPKQGYGRACKAGIRYLKMAPPSIVVFLDADHCDYPPDMHRLVQPIILSKADLVLGSRLKQRTENDSLRLHVRAANRFFSKLINLFYHTNLTDLGPFRAVRWSALTRLKMISETYGWSSEMIVKAARQKFNIVEIPVKYRRRIGKSKISGSFKASLKAALHIFYNIIIYSF
jgi:glycosyltransferase involved in cell wall biosynthesis